MLMYQKRMMVTILPEWEPIFERLKKERFYNSTQAEMIRYIIKLGLISLETQKET